MKQVWALFLGFLLVTVGVFAWVQRSVDPPVETIVASSLKSVQQQNRLSAFAARFVTVVTSAKSQMGFSAEKTLIIPALVRYEVDMAKMTAKDLAWDVASKTLTITMPPVELAGPQFDLAATREYQSGTVLMALTDVERLLDRENRAKASDDVMAQAKAAPMLKLARDASVKAVAANFALPLNAAGIEAKVVVR